MSSLPYRPNVCILLVNRDNKLLLGERLGEKNAWQLPQGGVEPDDTIEASVLRETEEELGIPQSSLRIVRRLDATHRYDFDRPPAYAVGRWRGQEQSFWLVEFLGEDSEINLSGSEPEFSAYRWCSADDVRRMAEAKRLPGYRDALKEFEEWLPSRLPSRGGSDPADPAAN